MRIFTSHPLVIIGASANGGPPIILFFLSSPVGAAVGRASLIAFFLFTDVWASLFYWQQGLIHRGTLIFTAVFLVPMAMVAAILSLFVSSLPTRISIATPLTPIMFLTIAGICRAFFMMLRVKRIDRDEIVFIIVLITDMISSYSLI